MAAPADLNDTQGLFDLDELRRSMQHCRTDKKLTA